MELTNIAPKLTSDELWNLMLFAGIDVELIPDYRMGQALMNRLYDLSEPLYLEVCASGIDPFYNNTVIKDFVEYICGGPVTFTNWQTYK